MTETAAPGLQAQTPERSDVDHRIVGLVVHGMGEHSPGSTLRQIVADFYPLIRRRIDPKASVSAKPLDEGDPAQVRISFRDGSNQEKYELCVTEVWWARSFHPLSFGGFITGLLGFFRTMWRRRKERPFWVWPPLAGFLNVTLWQRLVVDVAVMILLPVIAAVVLLIWLVESAGPLKRVLPKWVAGPLGFLVNVATRHLGDVWVYFRQPWEASQIRVRFEQRLLQELATLGDNVDTVFVIAHSLGTVVAFEALTGTRIAKAISDAFGEGRPSFHFFSVGSALNSAWDVVPDEERHRFYRPFPAPIRWLNIYSGHDPVPRGELRPPPEVEEGPRPEQRPVVNQMDLFSDHSAYWNNAEQVVAPTLDTITSGRLSSSLRMDARARERRVEMLAAAKALFWLVFPAVFVVFLVLGVVPDPAIVQEISGWIDDVPAFGRDAVRRWLLSPAFWAVAAAASGTVVYLAVVKSIWNAWDARVKYREPEIPE